jgi:lactoylglutathione lyase
MLRYHHTSRATKNIEATLAFYTAIGCEFEKRVRDDAQGLTRVVLRLPASDAKLQFIAFDDATFHASSSSWSEHLAFHTGEFDRALEAMLGAGGTLERAPYTLPGKTHRIAFVKDPDGFRLELVEKPTH